MAQQGLAQFATEYLPQHPEIKDRIDAIRDESEFVAAVLEAGTGAGFAFSGDEVRRVLAGRRGELSEEQLETVAGGRKAGGKQQEYLIVTMTDALISSYGP